MRGNMNMDVAPYAPVNVNPRTPPAGTQRGITGEFPVI